MMSSSFMSWPRMLVDMFFVVLLGLSTLLGTSASTSTVNECLVSCVLDGDGKLDLSTCGITDEDVDDVASCLDDVGRDNIVTWGLEENSLTALPDGIFLGLTALTQLYMRDNALTTVPEGVFSGLTALKELSMSRNALTTLPEGAFDGLGGLTDLWLYENSLTTLPEGVFGSLTSLTRLRLDGNSLECLPDIPSTFVALDDDATSQADGLHVDPYGDECGCSILGVTNNVCGEGACTPGEFGYTCAAATLAPVPAPTEAPVLVTLAPVPPPTEAPASATLAPGPAPTEAPASTTAAPESQPRPVPAPTPDSEGTLAPVPVPKPTPALGTTAPAVTSATVSSKEAPVGAIVGGVVGGAVVVGGLILLALVKTGRIKTRKQRGQSPGAGAAAGGSASYPTIPENPPAKQYPVRPQYPEPI